MCYRSLAGRVWVLHRLIQSDGNGTALRCAHARDSLTQYESGSVVMRWLPVRESPIVVYDLANDPFFARGAFIEERIRPRMRPNVANQHLLWEWAPTGGRLRQLTGLGLCEQLRRLSLWRVFFAGDSLQRIMFRSLVMLVSLDGTAIEVDVRPTRNNRTFKGRMACPAGPVELLFVETWYLGYDRDLCQGLVGNQEREFCLPWMASYSRSDLPTLLVTNTGPHPRNLTEFTQFFNSWLESMIDAQSSLSAHRRCNDRAYFRTTVEGHPGCERNLKPFLDPPPRSKLPYQWSSFESFNDQALRALQAAQAKGLHIGMLDVVPMTRLRGDGHLKSFADTPNADCLHYALPGIPDWWNHLLMSELSASRRGRG